MATLIVRNVDEEVKARLVQQAAKNGRSTESEVRHILRTATKEVDWISNWLERASTFSGVELDLPKRSAPRSLDLFGDES